MFANKCQVSTWLAYLMFVYLASSIYYYIITRSMGTPFNDSLTPEQLKLKDSSSQNRMSVFIQGLLVGVVIIYFVKPFSSCTYKDM
jgi:hypothetical protein